MPLRNRLTPFGEIVAVPGRGLLMGNRGILHDAAFERGLEDVGRRVDDRCVDGTAWPDSLEELEDPPTNQD